MWVKTNRWGISFSRKVEEVGGIVVTATAVEDLVFKGDRVIGVRTDREELYADLVIDASGVTSKLVIKAGLRGPLQPWQVYHGVKQVYQLGEEEINRRFGLKSGEGVAIAVMGDFLHGAIGGGFIYTNRDTISVGIVVSIDSMIDSVRKEVDKVGKPLDILEEMVSHPYVSRYLEGAKLVEYSAHNIPKGHKTMLEKPLRSGFLVVGDALGSFVKISGLIDGMRRTIATGIMAAQIYIC
jgi:electron transfer flavoprotein-quinone oxidoreductase